MVCDLESNTGSVWLTVADIAGIEEILGERHNMETKSKRLILRVSLKTTTINVTKDFPLHCTNTRHSSHHLLDNSGRLVVLQAFQVWMNVCHCSTPAVMFNSGSILFLLIMVYLYCFSHTYSTYTVSSLPLSCSVSSLLFNVFCFPITMGLNVWSLHSCLSCMNSS